MLQAFVITLREGLEAFLIIAISLAYLRKSGRTTLSPAVYWGTGVAVVPWMAYAVETTVRVSPLLTGPDDHRADVWTAYQSLSRQLDSGPLAVLSGSL